jgi:hypothetical protein
MAAIAFDLASSHRGRIEAGLGAMRAMLDAFVSSRLKLATAEAEHARARQNSSIDFR